MAYSVPADTPAVNPCLHLRLKANNRSSGRILIRSQKFRTAAVRWCLLHVTGTLHPWTLYCDCLSKTSTVATPADTPVWTGEIPYGSTPRWRASGGQALMREQESVSSRKELPQLFNSKWSALDMCTRDQIQVDSGGYIHTHVHMLDICNKIIK